MKVPQASHSDGRSIWCSAAGLVIASSCPNDGEYYLAIDSILGADAPPPRKVAPRNIRYQVTEGTALRLPPTQARSKLPRPALPPKKPDANSTVARGSGAAGSSSRRQPARAVLSVVGSDEQIYAAPSKHQSAAKTTAASDDDAIYGFSGLAVRDTARKRETKGVRSFFNKLGGSSKNAAPSIPDDEDSVFVPIESYRTGSTSKVSMKKLAEEEERLRRSAFERLVVHDRPRPETIGQENRGISSFKVDTHDHLRAAALSKPSPLAPETSRYHSSEGQQPQRVARVASSTLRRNGQRAQAARPVAVPTIGQEEMQRMCARDERTSSRPQSTYVQEPQQTSVVRQRPGPDVRPQVSRSVAPSTTQPPQAAAPTQDKTNRYHSQPYQEAEVAPQQETERYPTQPPYQDADVVELRRQIRQASAASSPGYPRQSSAAAAAGRGLYPPDRTSASFTANRPVQHHHQQPQQAVRRVVQQQTTNRPQSMLPIRSGGGDVMRSYSADPRPVSRAIDPRAAVSRAVDPRAAVRSPDPRAASGAIDPRAASGAIDPRRVSRAIDPRPVSCAVDPRAVDRSAWEDEQWMSSYPPQSIMSPSALDRGRQIPPPSVQRPVSTAVSSRRSYSLPTDGVQLVQRPSSADIFSHRSYSSHSLPAEVAGGRHTPVPRPASSDVFAPRSHLGDSVPTEVAQRVVDYLVHKCEQGSQPTSSPSRQSLPVMSPYDYQSAVPPQSRHSGLPVSQSHSRSRSASHSGGFHSLPTEAQYYPEVSSEAFVVDTQPRLRSSHGVGRYRMSLLPEGVDERRGSRRLSPLQEVLDERSGVFMKKLEEGCPVPQQVLDDIAHYNARHTLAISCAEHIVGNQKLQVIHMQPNISHKVQDMLEIAYEQGALNHHGSLLICGALSERSAVACLWVHPPQTLDRVNPQFLMVYNALQGTLGVAPVPADKPWTLTDIYRNFFSVKGFYSWETRGYLGVPRSFRDVTFHWKDWDKITTPIPISDTRRRITVDLSAAATAATSPADQFVDGHRRHTATAQSLPHY